MVPHDLRFSPTHEWVRVEGDTATVGISHFAVEQLTDPTNIELPKLGKNVQREAGFGEIESVKSVSDLYAPVSGEIVAVNDALREDASPVSADPYGKGWMIRIKMKDAAEVQQLLTAEQYAKQIASQGH